MRGRPVCILCLLLVVFLCVTDWLGFSMTSGNPLPEPVQTWIKKHPESAGRWSGARKMKIINLYI